MKNIQIVSDSYLCSNCGACFSVCKKNAIEFGTTNIGRLYAKVNENCINCGLCVNVCPTIDNGNLFNSFNDAFIGDIKNVYVGRVNDDTLYQNAQSGGIATGILAFLFKENKIDAAVVCQMVEGKTPIVKPVVITSVEELFKTQKSCYTPVALLTVLTEIEKYDSVAIVGLPCHLQGVVELQHKTNKYHNIKFKIGLICDRTLCAGIHDVLKRKVNYDIFRIHWREKYDEVSRRYDYKSAPIVAISSVGEKKILPRVYRIALKDFFTAPRCRVCWDKLNVFSDITLGDPWKLENIDMQRGESLVLARTSCGESLLNEMQKKNKLCLRDYDVDSPIKSQSINKRRKQVFRYSQALKHLPFSLDWYHCLHFDYSDCDVYAEEKTLSAFIDNEKLSREEIIQLALEEINNYTSSNNKIFVFVKKIFRIFRKLD